MSLKTNSFQRKKIKQHERLLTDPSYRQRVGPTKKHQLRKQQEKEWEEELKEAKAKISDGGDLVG